MPTPIDRLTLLLDQNALTGIDYVFVNPFYERFVRVYFLTDIRQLSTPFVINSTEEGGLDGSQFSIRNESDSAEPEIKVLNIQGLGFDGERQRSFINLLVESGGGFGRYRLRIADSRVDRFFNDVSFTFKTGCDSGEDCAERPAVCPPEQLLDFPIDYLARDFVSLRNALLDYIAQRFPQYTLPIEADVGVMLAEVMAALGDEFSYIQDRYAREAFLETANQRRSLRKKARLLDFEIHDGRSPTALLELTVSTGLDVEPGAHIDAKQGYRAWATSEGGDPIAFEIGLGLRDERDFAVHQAWNAKDRTPEGRLEPYGFDASEACLRVGATEMYLKGEIPWLEGLEGELPGRLMLLRTEPEDPAVPARRHFVRVQAFEALTDPLVLENGSPLAVTRVVWHQQDALPFQLDLDSLHISLNVVPATAGRTRSVQFVCGEELALTDDVDVAVERQGPLFSESTERPTLFLYGLPGTEEAGLGFLGPSLRSTLPEVRVFEPGPDGPANEWYFQRSLLGSNSTDEVFTLEDGVWRRIVAYQRAGQEVVHRDYATGRGFSLRFGDGVFGRIPGRGQRFQVDYRFGPAERANVPANAINRIDGIPGEEVRMASCVLAVTNPMEVTGGQNPESQRDIKLLTPEAFRADVLFAVRPEDYGEQAEKLDFLQRAHGTSRWTGSWTSMFVAGDPLGANSLTDEQREQLEAWMGCVRQTGRDVIVQNPKLLPIDLKIRICVEPYAYAAQVRALVEEVLVGSGGGSDQTAFFSPDNFTFGMPLRRSSLEAVIQSVPGVRFVRDIRVRERGVRSERDFAEPLLRVDPDQVIRLDNDPQRPGNGTLFVETEGGA